MVYHPDFPHYFYVCSDTAYCMCHCQMQYISLSNFKFADFFLLFPSFHAFNSLKNKRIITLPQKVNIHVHFTNT